VESWRLLRQFIADRTGWTLAYVDGLDGQDVADLLAFWNGKAKAKDRK
jgi:hypothetical protein